jgi:hypothetical protein
MAERGLAYGPAFRVLSDLHRGVEDAIATVQLPESVLREANAYRLHPALGDALLQVVAGAVPLEEDGSFSPFTYMPVGIRNIRVLSKIEDYRQPMYVYALRTSQESTPSPERVETNIYLLNGEGAVIVAFDALRCRDWAAAASGFVGDTSRWLYQVACRRAAQAAATNSRWKAVADFCRLATSDGIWPINSLRRAALAFWLR